MPGGTANGRVLAAAAVLHRNSYDHADTRFGEKCSICLERAEAALAAADRAAAAFPGRCPCCGRTAILTDECPECGRLCCSDACAGAHAAIEAGALGRVLPGDLAGVELDEIGGRAAAPDGLAPDRRSPGGGRLRSGLAACAPAREGGA